MPFEWGKNDCVLFSADAVLAITGQDYAKEYRTYSSAKEAARLIKKLGGLEAIATSALGSPIPKADLTAGDIALVTTPNGNCLSVYGGSACVGPGKHGIILVGRENVLVAWGVV